MTGKDPVAGDSRRETVKFLKPSLAQIKRWGQLNRGTVRRGEGLFLVEGFKVVEALLRSSWSVNAVLVMEETKERWDSLLPLRRGAFGVYAIGRVAWKKLSQDRAPEGIMAVATLPPREEAVKFLESLSGNLLLLHELNNPNNLGAVMRTAHWFGFTGIILSRNSVDFAHPKVVRASMGSLFDLSILADADFEAILPRLKGRFRLIGSDVRTGSPPHRCECPTALMLGSESHGLPKELTGLADEIWRIPGSGRAESLSLPQAAAILMYACTATA